MTKKPTLPASVDTAFVVDYLATRGLKDTREAQALVVRAMREFPGKAEADRTALSAYLDRRLLR